MFWLLFLAVSVKDASPLRAGCAADESPVATLPAGTTVTIRFAMAGESTPCYKVAAEVAGKTIEGYLSASQLDGLEDFDQARRQAAHVGLAEVMQAIKASAPEPTSLTIMSASRGLSIEATHLIESGQPAKALQILEPSAGKSKDPGLLALAGVAAWKADDSRNALEYWRRSLTLKPNPELEALIRKVERESKADQSADKLVGMRVVLRYEGTAVNTDTARQMLAALDEEYFRISQQLGCFAEEKIVAIVQSPDAYRKTTNSAEWSGGQFDGRIRVPVLSGQTMDANIRRVFAHETVHACLAMLGHWPSWLHEGLAQKLSGETLSPRIRQRIAEMIRDHKLPRLESLGQDWSRLDTEHAAVAYGLSLFAVEMLYESQIGITTVLRNPDRLAVITADLDKRLGL